ncbi:hypothetical protein HPB48_008727 [Haemaphysalis longicornis]|uniref:5' nucleotidase n=1 Tax=Haemaphysalis longicornis TaxID=44386 RepID=A0A9J6H4P4_HAELO|nr:hypothetical protein HPB48_008727 [Haemaphysalis longicornis]
MFVHRTEDSTSGRTNFGWPVVLLVFCLELAARVGGADTNSEPFTLTILHINDLHSHFDPTDPYGGRCRPGMEDRCVGGAARHLHLVRRGYYGYTLGAYAIRIVSTGLARWR